MMVVVGVVVVKAVRGVVVVGNGVMVGRVNESVTGVVAPAESVSVEAVSVGRISEVGEGVMASVNVSVLVSVGAGVLTGYSVALVGT